MKRLFKTACVLLSAVVMFAAFMSLAACGEDLKQVEVRVEVYDDSLSTPALVKKTIKITLYRHLADSTVDAITSYINKGYYNGLVLYKLASGATQQIMVGGLQYDGDSGNVIDYVSTKNYVRSIQPEFERAGVSGSDLTNVAGSIGLWRTWSENGSYATQNNEAFKSGKSTLYMPTSNISGYNGCFTVFGKIDLSDEETSKAVDLIKDVLDSDQYRTSYTVYYTGEYDNLVYHCVTTEKFDEDYPDYPEGKFKDDGGFKAEGDQFVCYNKQDVYIPVAEDSGITKVYAKIVSVKMA